MNEVERRCRFCDGFLGKVIDGQSFVVGRVEIWHRTKIFCSCGRSNFTFVPDKIPEDELPPDVYDIKRNLARQNKKYKEENNAENIPQDN